jgi:hypothetical protein
VSIVFSISNFFVNKIECGLAAVIQLYIGTFYGYNTQHIE